MTLLWEGLAFLGCLLLSEVPAVRSCLLAEKLRSLQLSKETFNVYCLSTLIPQQLYLNNIAVSSEVQIYLASF